MIRYQVMKTVDTENGSHTIPLKVVTLADNARGADEYIALRKRGYKLHRLDFQPTEDR